MAVNQLKIVVSILREISDGNPFPKATDYGIDNNVYNDILEAMQDDNLVKNIRFQHDSTKKVVAAFPSDATITIRGMEYLNENSALAKTYKGLKEVREWLPF